MKKGLVLEGGGMRGLFTAGVLDVFMENGIEFDGAVGVSAGALFGCNYKSKQPGRAIRYNVRYCSDRRYVSYYNLLTTGNIFNVDFCYREIPFELDLWDYETFEKNPMEFYAVCTDVETGRPFYYRCTDGLERDITYFRASGSLPLVSQIVRVDGMKLLDGGVSDAIPLEFFQSLGYDKNVVIETRPADYRKEPNKLMPLAELVYGRKYPGITRAMRDRHLMYNAELDFVNEKAALGEALVIRPPRALNVSQTEKDPDKLKRAYLTGRKAARENLERVKDYLANEESGENAL